MTISSELGKSDYRVSVLIPEIRLLNNDRYLSGFGRHSKGNCASLPSKNTSTLSLGKRFKDSQAFHLDILSLLCNGKCWIFFESITKISTFLNLELIASLLKSPCTFNIVAFAYSS